MFFFFFVVGVGLILLEKYITIHAKPVSESEMLL